MKFDALQVLEQMNAEFGAIGTSDVLVRNHSFFKDMVIFRLSVFSSTNNSYHSEFCIHKNTLNDDSMTSLVNLHFLSAYHKLKRLIHYGF